MELILQAVGSVGFPVAVATYLLVRIEGKLEDLTVGIARLTEALAGMRRQVEQKEQKHKEQ
ncbi:MAG TPA: YvrJ family protein [Bacillota bacterium]|nr:YvrJ family protein [Peptococcaceae bacterium]HPU35881.1 YvrJ family protein [Bacillota bacterium]HPZ44340.1 YvrJ family protein [Bacillota bacterium]HQD77115.1 YvrJ family protein [Bacillota bacterium]HUM59575.1 YvrJ family protein [Bacillota bacterium]